MNPETSKIHAINAKYISETATTMTDPGQNCPKDI